jgi:hypothetical protein
MPRPSKINPGDRVYSDFEVVRGFSLDPGVFEEPHIGIGARFSYRGVQENPDITRFWQALGAPMEAIWRPGARIAGAGTIATLVVRAIGLYRDRGLLPAEGAHNVFGEVVCFDGVTTHDPEQGDVSDYPDSVPHIDFVPPEPPVAAFFASNKGGTIGWRGGQGFEYADNTRPSYAGPDVEAMEHVSLQPGQFLFSPDARTFVHARDPSVDNAGRMLVRLFVGP